MSHRVVFSIVAIVLAGLAALMVLIKTPTANLSAPPPGGDFTLNSADGPVSLQQFRGKVVVIYFGYTYCPDICPTALSDIAAALKQISPDRLSRTAILFVSVDPERDSPARLKEYAAFFHPSILGVTASATEIQRVAKQYGVFYARQAADGNGHYSVDHSSQTYVIAPDGRLAEILPHASTPAKIYGSIMQFIK